MMTNDDCICRLEGMLEAQESIESYILDDDSDPEDLRRLIGKSKPSSGLSVR